MRNYHDRFIPSSNGSQMDVFEKRLDELGLKLRKQEVEHLGLVEALPVVVGA